MKARAHVRARASAAVPSPGDGRPASRYRGTLYGGGAKPTELAPRPRSLPVLRDPEHTGSLTGHILAQGRSDEGAPTHSRTARLILGLLVGLGIFVTIGLLVMAGIGGVFGTLFGELLTR